MKLETLANCLGVDIEKIEQENEFSFETNQPWAIYYVLTAEERIEVAKKILTETDENKQFIESEINNIIPHDEMAIVGNYFIYKIA